MEYDALLSRQIARDLLHALSHRHDYTWTAFSQTSLQHWWEQVDNMLVDLHLSVKNKRIKPGSSLGELTDGDANHYAIPHTQIRP